MRRILIVLLALGVGVAFAGRPSPKPPKDPIIPVPICYDGPVVYLGECPPPPVEPVPL